MSYEIRAMSFVEILDTALRLVTNHFVLLVGLMAIVHVPGGLVVAYMTADLAQVLDEISADQAAAVMTTGTAAFLVTMTVFSVLYPIMLTATMYAIDQLYHDREVGLGEALGQGMSNFKEVLGTWFVVTSLVSLGFICFVVPGIYLSLALVVVWPVMQIEKRFGMQAVRRSRELMNGNLLRAMGIFLVAGLAAGVLGGAVAWIPFVGLVGSLITQSATAAFAAATQMVLYFDIRCRKEGFDLERQA